MRKKTYIFDLDGTIIEHQPPAHRGEPMRPLPNSIETLKSIRNEGHSMILLTARPLECYSETTSGLAKLGILDYFDDVIYNVGSGERVLVNDLKPESDLPTARSINLIRNQGFGYGDL